MVKMKKNNRELIRHLQKRVAVTDAKVIQLVSEIENIKEACLVMAKVLETINLEVFGDEG